jgi:hypothetical protein
MKNIIPMRQEVRMFAHCRSPAEESSEFFSIMCYAHLRGSRGSTGSTVSDYGLDDRGSIPDRDGGFFF